MKGKPIILCFLICNVNLILLTSCNSLKISRATTVDSLWVVNNSEYHFATRYFADYWFHPFRRNNTLNFNESFNQQLKKIKRNQVLLYSAHTTVTPLCTTVSLVYEKVDTDSLIDFIIQDFRRNNAKNIIRDSKQIGKNNVMILKYTLIDKSLKIPIRFIEYYLSRNQTCFRIVFYTSCGEEEWLVSESEPIIEEVVL